jgi:hypothetical protein
MIELIYQLNNLEKEILREEKRMKSLQEKREELIQKILEERT